MVEAHCQNENCDRSPWVLRKPLPEYRNGGPQCPDCGSTKVTDAQGRRLSLLAEKRRAGPEQAHQPPPDDTLPASRPRQQEASLPATPDGMSEIEQGLALGTTVHDAVAGEGQDKKIGMARLAKLLGGVSASYGNRLEENAIDERERAKNVSQEELQPVESLANCSVCGQQIQGLPDQPEFQCPGCGTLLQNPDFDRGTRPPRQGQPEDSRGGGLREGEFHEP